MNCEKISQVINQIDIDYISEALEVESMISNKNKNKVILFYKNYRFAACMCMIVLAIMLSFTTAFATSESFRETIVRILYPLYTSDEIKKLDSGHLTSSFDETDTLLTFLDKFNKEKMELGIFARKENGYAYTLVHNTSDVMEADNIIDSVFAIVESNISNYKLLITMQKIPYEETTGIWQVTAYQIVMAEKADKILEEMPLYTPLDDEAENFSETNKNPADTTIKAEGACAVIYNANEKENISTLTEEESEQIKAVFASYSLSDDLSITGSPDMVIKFEDVDYIFSQDGEVLVEDGEACSQVTLTSDDKKFLLSLFRSHGISVSLER